MNKLLKKRMLIISISLAFLLLINICVSYSYYLGKVVANENDTILSIKSTGIVITYENNSDVIDESNVVPGWSATKNFSISSTVLEKQLNESTSNLWYEIYLYIDQNDFPDNVLTYSFSSTGNNVGNGLVAEARTNIGLPLSTELNAITIGTGNVAVGENVHNYSITFNYSSENYENSNYPDCLFKIHIGVKVVVNSVINLNLDGGEIEGTTTKYVSKGGTITLQTPVKENAVFNGWLVTNGNATIIGNEITVNDANVEVQAMWIINAKASSVITIDLDGGTWSGGTSIQTETNTVLKLERPTKMYYTFVKWELVDGNADISGDNIIVYDRKVKIKAIFIDTVPVFTYKKSDGTDARYLILHDDTANWRIKFLESGTLIFQSFRNIEDNKIDIFLVGAGGSGISYAGGGGGYVKTIKNYVIYPGNEYSITVGQGVKDSNGGTTSAFEHTASGGKKASYNYVMNWENNGCTGGDGYYNGGAGGSGGGANGAGGTDGANGVSGPKRSYYDGCNNDQLYHNGGTGSGSTTREFGESDGELYSSGGGTNINGGENTGNGGYGNNPGGSGIVIFRNHRE